MYVLQVALKEKPSSVSLLSRKIMEQDDPCDSWSDSTYKIKSKKKEEPKDEPKGVATVPHHKDSLRARA